MSYLQTGINLGISGIKNKMKISVHYLLLLLLLHVGIMQIFTIIL